MFFFLSFFCNYVCFSYNQNWPTCKEVKIRNLRRQRKLSDLYMVYTRKMQLYAKFIQRNKAKLAYLNITQHNFTNNKQQLKINIQL